ncbi:MAG: hypothetical protein RIA63_09165 [Cyclobacteriaceae bacterium]
MKKAEFIPFENKKDAQVLYDISLTPQQRVDRMFELIDATLYFQKEYTRLHKKNAITLKRANGVLS